MFCLLRKYNSRARRPGGARGATARRVALEHFAESALKPTSASACVAPDPARSAPRPLYTLQPLTSLTSQFQVR